MSPAPATQGGRLHHGGDGISREALLAAGPAERRSMLGNYFRGRLGQVLGMPAGDVDVDTPVNAFGLDSLMAIQLKNRIEGEVGVAVPLVAFLQGLTVSQLVERAADQLAEAAPAPTAGHLAEKPAAANEGLADRVGEMSEAEVDAALHALMAREANGRNGH